MNIHPILVHFPIALMTIYGILELIRYKKITNQIYWFYLKASLVIIATLTAFLSLGTGEIAEDLYNSSYNSLIELHANFANLSTYIFGFIAIIYLFSWINKTEFNQKILDSKARDWWIKVINFINKILENSTLMIILSILGLISISITGSLGGAIVYGPDVDPIVNFIYYIFF